MTDNEIAEFFVLRVGKLADGQLFMVHETQTGTETMMTLSQVKLLNQSQ